MAHRWFRSTEENPAFTGPSRKRRTLIGLWLCDLKSTLLPVMNNDGIRTFYFGTFSLRLTGISPRSPIEL